MTTIERMENYIKKEDLSNWRYQMNTEEALALKDMLMRSGTLHTIAMAFDYGRAKGLREAKAGVKA